MLPTSVPCLKKARLARPFVVPKEEYSRLVTHTGSLLHVHRLDCPKYPGHYCLWVYVGAWGQAVCGTSSDAHRNLFGLMSARGVHQIEEGVEVCTVMLVYSFSYVRPRRDPIIIQYLIPWSTPRPFVPPVPLPLSILKGFERTCATDWDYSRNKY